jgi:predicted enzyme related to lactoylglutathione lyase
MSERDQYPHGVPCWIDTAQADPSSALDFYGALLGWEFVGPGAMPGDPPGEYYVARLRGRDVAGISSQPPGPPSPPAWTTYVAVKSADDAADRAREAGGTLLVEPFDAPPAGRMAVLSDPAGAMFCVWQAGDRRGAQIVNEPSAWAMSMLSTSDPDGAKAFYRAMFGWEAEAFGSEVTLFRLPGFVGGEPAQPVPRDLVAAMTPGGAEASWGVDLWVEDADASAATASKLGGAVRVAPRDIPGFRNAVIADPQGAVLSVSQLLTPAVVR